MLGFYVHYNQWCINKPPYDKTNNVVVRPAKTQISLGIRSASDQSLRCPHEESLGP